MFYICCYKYVKIMSKKSKLKKGDVLMCKSGFPDKENLIINFTHYDNVRH